MLKRNHFIQICSLLTIQIKVQSPGNKLQKIEDVSYCGCFTRKIVLYGREFTSCFESIGQIVLHILDVDLFCFLILENQKKNIRIINQKYTNTIEYKDLVPQCEPIDLIFLAGSLLSFISELFFGLIKINCNAKRIFQISGFQTLGCDTRVSHQDDLRKNYRCM